MIAGDPDRNRGVNKGGEANNNNHPSESWLIDDFAALSGVLSSAYVRLLLRRGGVFWLFTPGGGQPEP